MSAFTQRLKKDSISGLVVFLVAVPLCIGIAIASGAPAFSGLISGIVGGIVAGIFSRSHTSVSGPAAALTSVLVTQLATLGSFDALLMAIVAAGIIQVIMGIAQLGVISNYFPSIVVKGLLAAIGLILIGKKLPDLFGFKQANNYEYSTQLIDAQILKDFTHYLGHFHLGALIVGLVSLAVMILWERIKFIKKTKIPAPLAVIIIGTGLSLLIGLNASFKLGADELVSVPVSKTLGEFLGNFRQPAFQRFFELDIWMAGVVIALSASLATLLNVEAVDKLDPHSRNTPKNWELIAQGIGNVVSGLIGGIPITSEVVRGSLNVAYGAQTKLSTIIHGILLLMSVSLFPFILNYIPLSTLAAVLIVTGYKLAKPAIFIDSYKKGLQQFIPFMVTIIAILTIGLLKGIGIGLVLGLIFVIRNDMVSALRINKEKHYDEEVDRLVLPQITSFINKAKMRQILNEIKPESKVIVDASVTRYIDGDILEVIKNFKHIMAPEKNIRLSMVGFKEKYGLNDEVTHRNVVTKELQDKLTPQDVLGILEEGNKRFLNGSKIEKDMEAQRSITSSDGQHPLAVILGCIDSRTTTEIIFDLGMGDVFSIRIAGNVVNEDILASMEFACKVAGAKLIVVLGHTNCGAIKGACDNVELGKMSILFDKIQPAIDAEYATRTDRNSNNPLFVKNVTRLNVHNSVFYVADHSEILSEMINKGEVGIVGGMYDIKTGEVKFTPMYQGKKAPK